jgi:hypothetical protein
MQTYNGVNVPSTIKTGLIVSAFQNEIDHEKLIEYRDIMSHEMLAHSFPPIMGFPSEIDENDIGNLFINGEEIQESDLGKKVWYVTDGHHRSMAASDAGIPYLEVTLDYSTITNETDFKNF